MDEHGQKDAGGGEAEETLTGLSGAEERSAESRLPNGSAPNPRPGLVGDGDTDLTLPDWRDPPTGEIPRLIEELVGEPLPNWSSSRAGDISGELPEVDLDVTIQANGAVWPSGAIGGDTLVQPPTASEPSRSTGVRPPQRSYFKLGSARPRRGPSKHSKRSRRKEVAASTSRQEEEALGDAASADGGGGRSKLVSSITGVLLGAVVLGAFAVGRLGAVVVVALALTLATGELYGLLRKGGYRPAAFLGLPATIVSAVGVYFFGLGAIGAAMGALAFATVAWYTMGRPSSSLVGGAGSTLLGALWVGGLGSFGVALLAPSRFGGDGLGLLLGTLICTSGADTFAYFGGSLFGRHKLAERISPNKTIEGVIIGGLASIAFGALALPHIHPFTIVAGGLAGLAVAVVAPLGDLAESALKREVKIKDSSHLLPGHGGMLDRIDGILFVLPVVYALFTLLRLG